LEPLFDKDVKEEIPLVAADEQEIIAKCFDYVDHRHNPWKKGWEKTIVECYDFVELRQWDGSDMQLLAMTGVPTLSIDRIGRGIDVIQGIRANTDNRKRIVPRESGDDRVAKLLDKVADFVDYNGNFGETRDEAFSSMIKIGEGIRKLGFDPEKGEVWCEFVPSEDIGYSGSKSKQLDDATWVWHRQMMYWESAMRINPEKAGQLKAMRNNLVSQWDKMRGSNTKGSFVQDYGNLVVTTYDNREYIPDQVEIWEFWFERKVPFSKIGSIESIPGQTVVGPDGTPFQLPDQSVPRVRNEAADYQPLGGEQHLGIGVKTSWEQFIIASSGGKANGMLLKQATSKYPFHNYVRTCAEVKKSGQPFGYVERVIPHQKRKNIAWSQKVTYNNKAIKSPLVGRNIENIEDKIQQTQLGAMLLLNKNEEVINLNVQPQVNLYALEESSAADRDMDFAAGATEPVLRGSSEPSSSGIKLSLQQNAAVTPLNKWVNAERLAELSFWRKCLTIMITEFPVEKMARILGQEEFINVVVGKRDPLTGQPVQQPLQFPLQLSTEEYDVVIEDTAVSDMANQQSFNAMMAMRGSEIPFEDDTIIKNAPIKDVDDAIASNERAKSDIMKQMAQTIQMLQAQLEQTQKLIPPENRMPQAPKNGKGANQHANAATGKHAPQAGQNSMLGGAGYAQSGMGGMGGASGMGVGV